MLNCVKKITTENNVETKQPRLQSRLKKSQLAITKISIVRNKISTCHHENLDCS